MEYIGKKVSVPLGGVWVNMKVVDVKQAYGKDRFLVIPVEGSGEVWVEKVNLIK